MVVQLARQMVVQTAAQWDACKADELGALTAGKTVFLMAAWMGDDKVA